MEGTKIMDEKVRNITLDQKYNTTYLRHRNRPHICKEQYISMKISCICNVLYILFLGYTRSKWVRDIQRKLAEL